MLCLPSRILGLDSHHIGNHGAGTTMATTPEHQRVIQQLRGAKPCILPSLLVCDFGNLQREVEQLAEAGVTALHLEGIGNATRLYERAGFRRRPHALMTWQA